MGGSLGLNVNTKTIRTRSDSMFLKATSVIELSFVWMINFSEVNSLTCKVCLRIQVDRSLTLS